MNHIDHALVPKAHTPLYLMHKWWARKPHNIVREYIETYTKTGDIVLDPFCGSGVTALEALKAERKAIAIDMDPIATFITKMSSIPIDLKKLDHVFKKIENNAKEKIEGLYKTNCPNCGRSAIIICTHWEGNKPIRIMYSCPDCGKDCVKKSVEQKDIRNINKINKIDIELWYPKEALRYPDGREFKEGTHDPNIDKVSDLFTHRNLLALSILYGEIENLPKGKIKDIMHFAFTSMVHLASKLTPVRPTRLCSSFWAMHRYWVPPIYMETNVWRLFESAYKGRQSIVKGKIESNDEIATYKDAKTFKDIDDGANILVKTQNALELTDIIPQNSVDYVFTDPPYGGSIQYFELSTLWASWLKGPKGDKEFDLNFADEITINKQQKKDFDYYHNMLKAAFSEIYKVLKPGKWMTVTFHNTSIKVWNSILRAVLLAGFDLEKIIYQPPPRPSAKGLLQPFGSAVGDYYIRFRKPRRKKLPTDEQLNEERFRTIVVEAAKKIIAERGEPTPYQFILNGIIYELQSEKVLLSGTTDIDSIMKKHVGTVFELKDIRDEKGKVVGKCWWIKDRKSVPYIETVPLNERVERAVIEALRGVKVTFDDILQKVFITFPNALTPTTQSVRDILKEYAEKTSDGKWRLKRSVEVRESEHSKMIYFLGVLGRKAGYNVWVGVREQGDEYNKIKLSTLCDEKSPRLRHIPIENQERIKFIDVLWYKEGKIYYEFEVENTTTITESIVRGSNIPYNDVERIIVFPKERENIFSKKIEEPLLKEKIKEYNWKFMLYDDLEVFHEKHKRAKRIEIKRFNAMFKMPKLKNQTQKNLLEYN